MKISAIASASARGIPATALAPVTSLGADLMADVKFFGSYSRWNEQTNAQETWVEAVSRVMQMHKEKYADRLTSRLLDLMSEAELAYAGKRVLGAQRALQFGGAQLRKHEARMYNCSASYADRPRFFQEMMYLLLCGCGVGFSVQRRHTSKLPRLRSRGDEAKTFIVPDSIEGWADAFGVLISSYFSERATFPEYTGKRVHFDFSLIRPKGSPISGGFKAPGSEGLRQSLIRCEALLEAALTVNAGKDTEIAPITIYDFCMHMADAVLSGGVRRSATICLFDKDDKEMLSAKIGDWFSKHPQRGRSNNSAILKRDELSKSEWRGIMNMVEDFGEPGFVFVDDLDTLVNPCVEIGLYAKWIEMMKKMAEEGKEDDPAITSGFQFCNLTEINGAACSSLEAFLANCRAAAILGTIQAGYTDFKYVTEATRRITENEALIGVSITGWMNNPQILFNEEYLKAGAEVVKAVNREVAALIGIKAAARTTCAKPSGNASVLLKTASGIHGEHAPRYIRNVQLNREEEVAKLMMKFNPKMVQNSVWAPNGTDVIVSFPLEAPENSIFKGDLLGVKQLEFVKKAQQFWVESGTNHELCVIPSLRHNISNTIGVDDWNEVSDYIYENRFHFAGISLLAAAGDKAYVQAPFTEVPTAEQMVQSYGEAALMASGLVVDGLHAFDDNLWEGLSKVMEWGIPVNGVLTAIDIQNDMTTMFAIQTDVPDALQRDWIRRVHNFALNFMGGNLQKTEFCLKDSYNLHQWVTLKRTMTAIDFPKLLRERSAVSADTLGAAGCSGGQCEVIF